MTDPELPTCLTRGIALTQARLQTSLGSELPSPCRSVVAHGSLEPDGLESPRRWLEAAAAATPLAGWWRPG